MWLLQAFIKKIPHLRAIEMFLFLQVQLAASMSIFCGVLCIVWDNFFASD